MTSWVPPLFAKFGEKLKDLFTKQYDVKQHELKVKSVVEPRLTIESTASLGEGNALGGAAKLKFKPPTFGDIEADVNTNGNSTATIKALMLYEGLSVNLKGEHKPSEKDAVKQGNVNLAAEYRQNAFAGSSAVNVTKGGEYSGEMTAVTGFDGFSVGAQGLYDFSAAAKHDYNVAMEYTPTPVYTITVKTLEQMNKASIGYLHNIKRDKLTTQVGGQFEFSRAPGAARVFTLGAEHPFDDKTKVKGKLNTNYLLAAMLEHKLSNPLMKFQTAAEWNVKLQPAPTKFGIGLAFGEGADA
jgi:hypothetical protein